MAIAITVILILTVTTFICTLRGLVAGDNPLAVGTVVGGSGPIDGGGIGVPATGLSDLSTATWLMLLFGMLSVGLCCS